MGLLSNLQRKQTEYETTTSLRRKEAMVAYLFIAPAFIGFAVFVAGPMLYALGISLFKWNIFQPPEFVGLDNYVKLFSDPWVWTGFRNTVVFTIFVVSLDVVVALSLAVALQHKMPIALRNFFRTTYILPIVTSVAAIAVILKFMLSTNLGVFNHYLVEFGFERVAWLESRNTAMLSLVLTTVWKTFGFDLLLFSAGIQNIPKQLYEAADIDGASAWQKFVRITIPQLSPTIFFVIVVSVIGHLQMFDQAKIMTSGGPGDATTTVVMVIWDKLSQVQYGYGSSIASAFFVLILILTGIQFWLSRRWVYYEGAQE